MRKTSIVLIIILICLLVYAMLGTFPDGYTLEPVIKGNRTSSLLPFRRGERLTYEVRYKKVKLGESVLTFHGE